MNRTAVEQIKERLPIDTVVGQYVKLEKAGKSFKARCPFHNEKSASFFVSPDRGGYFCFGCGAKGDIFSFVEQFEGLDFRGALKILAERAGVPLVYDKKADGERDQLFQIMEEAALFFEKRLADTKDVQEYVKGRGITEKSQSEFRIGWAPEGWQNLRDHLKRKGFSEALMEKAGLIKKNEKDIGSRVEGVENASPAKPYTLNPTPSFYDRFRGRVMFPITDSSGRVIAFSGRILKDDGKSAKYLNSPDTPLYDKSLVLYGLDKAKTYIRQLNYTIMVEGQMDLVMSHQAGVKNTVASSGTALADETAAQSGAISNLGLMRRLSPNVIIAFDSDSAGRKAALRAAAIALSIGMDVKVADLVGGKDPADLVKENPDNWKNALRNAKLVVEFELDNVIREIPDARKLAKAVPERILPLVARIESSSDQSHFIQMISDKAKIPTDALWQDLKVVINRQKQAETSSATVTSTPRKMTSEIPRRMDLVERRLFGLLTLMEKQSWPQAGEYREQIKKIADASYEERMKRIEPLMSDILFEAESFFGEDTKYWDNHMKELMFNFEEDMINQELIDTMQELKTAEKAGKQEVVAELAKKCQVLSMRKAEIVKKRK